jgi:hypothetical protein
LTKAGNAAIDPDKSGKVVLAGPAGVMSKPLVKHSTPVLVMSFRGS